MLYKKAQVKSVSPRKKTRQGQGTNSKANHGRKQSRGQGH